MEFTFLTGIITFIISAIVALAGLTYKKPILARKIIHTLLFSLVAIYVAMFMYDQGYGIGLNKKISVIDSVTKKMLKYGIVHFSNGKVDTTILATSDSIPKSPQDLVLKYNIEDSIDLSARNELADKNKRMRPILILLSFIGISLIFLKYLTTVFENERNDIINDKSSEIE